MGIAERVQATLNVRPGEGRTTGLMLAHSFFMGLATVFFETASAALFLERFGPETLPLVYLAAAGLNTLTGWIYASVQARVRFTTLMTATLILLLVTTAGLRLGLALTSAGALLFATLVWYRTVSALTDLEYWAMAGRLYDVRQAKRLFGLIGSGEVVARITGSFAIPLLIGRIGVPNLLTLSAAAMAACLVMVWVVLPRAGEAGAPVVAIAPRPKAARSTWRDPYLRLIFALTFFGVLAKYFVDFAFLAELRRHFGDAHGLASSLAIFSGVTQTLSFLTRVFVSGRVLDRHGIRVGLLVLPIAHVACTLLLVGAGLGAAPTAAVFWLVLANQGLYKTLKHPIDNPSFKVLYQPLPKERRLGAQIAVETLVTPVTIGIAGLVMLLFTRVLTYNPVRFASAMAVDFGGWMAVAVVAGRAYVGALKDALKGRLDDEHAFLLLDDAASLRVLGERLRSARPEDVLPALELLERGGHRRLDAAVTGLLGHAAPEVRRAAVAFLEAQRLPGAAAALRARLAVEPVASVRAAAVRGLCALSGKDAAPELARLLDDPREEMRRAATIGLLAAAVPAAEERVAAAARSPARAERVWAAQVLAEARQARCHPLLRPLLEDGEVSVRRAALAAAGRLRAPELWPLVAEGLGERATAGVAAAALGQGGAAAVDHLDAAFWRARHAAVRAQIVRVWGRIGAAAVAPLVERLRFPDARVRHEVLLALQAGGYRAERPEAAARIEEAFGRELEDAAWKLAVVRDLGDSPETSLVRSALEREVEAARRRVLLLLSFVLDERAIRRAAENLDHESRDRRAYALEMLDVTLPAEWRERLMPLYEELTPAGRCDLLGALHPQPAMPVGERLREMLRQPPGRLASWTLASVLHAAVGLGIDVEIPASVGLEGADGALVRETAGWAQARLAELDTGPLRRPSMGQGSRRASMLTIEKVIILKSVQMFAEASDEILSDVAAIVEEADVPAGGVVFEKGDRGDGMYVIVDGRVRVYDGERTITELGPRDIFGELALLDPEPRLAAVAALVPTRLLRLDREGFLELMEANIEIVRGVLHVLCERLRRTSLAREPYHDVR
jgi:HEAT repeat protein